VYIHFVMNSQTEFSAPWCLLLKCMTSFCIVFLAGIPIIAWFEGDPETWLTLLPLFLLISGALFLIRGYELRPGELIIKRLGWNSRIDLTDLQSAEADPKAMNKSIRTCGNGGFFCFAGWFRSKKLGNYRAFVTDPKNCVVLKLEKRTVVISPGDPDAFVAAASGGCS